MLVAVGIQICNENSVIGIQLYFLMQCNFIQYLAMLKILTMKRLNDELEMYDKSRLNVTHLKERSIMVITSPCFRRSDCCNTSPFTEVGLTELKFVKMTWMGKDNATSNRRFKHFYSVLSADRINTYLL